MADCHSHLCAALPTNHQGAWNDISTQGIRIKLMNWSMPRRVCIHSCIWKDWCSREVLKRLESLAIWNTGIAEMHEAAEIQKQLSGLFNQHPWRRKKQYEICQGWHLCNPLKQSLYIQSLQGQWLRELLQSLLHSANETVGQNEWPMEGGIYKIQSYPSFTQIK